MTFRLLRLVSDAGKLVPDEAPTNLVTSLPDEPLVPLAAPREVKCFYQRSPQEDRAR